MIRKSYCAAGYPTWWALAALLPVLLLWSMQPAHAVPAFASQTGQPCTACHVGGFGPQLTPFGRAFKISGYTQDGGSGLASKIPLSAMVLSSLTQTGGSQDPPPANHFSKNTNFAIDQISVFLAGRVNDYFGGFIQGTYDGIGVAESLDNTDLRATYEFDPGGHTLRVGLSLNNNPTVQDPWNSTYAWGYPFVASALAPTPTAAPLLTGALAGNVVGITAYGWWDSKIYVEGGAYEVMNDRMAKTLGVYPQTGNGAGAIPYLRVAYEWDWGKNSAHVGALYMHADLQPLDSVGAGSDSYTDYGMDAGYEFIGGGKNIYTVNAIFMHEEQNLRATYGLGGSATPRKSLNDFRVNGTWVYDQTYQVTLGVDETYGTADSVLYAPATVTGSNNGSPNSTAFIGEVDWIPFGKEKSWGAPFANLKLGMQFVVYPEFNGGGSNYDGFGRSAYGNDTLYAFAWLAF
jgi:hypothetical protein